MKQNFWTVSSLFFNACITGISILLPLYIIFLQGTVLDVALSFSLFNAGLIISALFWGHLIDNFENRKRIIVFSYLGTVLGSIALYWITNLVLIGIIYALIGFMRQGSQPAINLLIIETEQKNHWGKVISRIQLISVLGMILAVTSGVFWIAIMGLRSYIFLCSGFGVLATLIAQTCIPESQIQFESNILYKFTSTMFNRVRRNPVVLPKLPSLKEIDTLLKMVKTSMLQAFPIFLCSSFFFYASSGMYFTAITPFLKQNMISDSVIFAVYLTLYLSQVITFTFSSKFVDKYGEKNSTVISLILRAVGTGLTLVAAIYFNASTILLAIVLSFIFLDTAFSLYSTSTSLILFELLPFRRRGYYLGVFGAITSIGLLFGSLLSGEISALFGFPTSFVLATAFLIISLILMKIFKR